ncbi:hypothetical protein RHGRI_018820 [Rhododendron griersonianum]|uniref:J domain-containing protein n=1 Tax=Rhododendron griersonianum TaxID=479676 RepID=A0AAV6K2W1_9ERIC|nr:hypothetical protein RHGRI_018820 [Rhododendron griersonianum]
MFTTLNLPSMTPLRLSSENTIIHPSLTRTTTRSGRQTFSFSGRHTCKAVCAETAPALEPRNQRQRGGSLYEVLQVKRNASVTEIKTAYRSLAKLYHPDAVVSESAPDGRDFIEIHNAYATLSDPTARAMYDLSLGSGRRPFGYTAAGGGFRSGFYPTRRWETDQCW